MYSFGMANRDIQNHIKKIYNADVPPELISGITSAVMEEVKERRTVRWKAPMR
jgi:transposase-like protein